MKARKYTWFFLPASVVMGILAWWLWYTWLHLPTVNLDDKYKDLIQKNVTRELKILEKETYQIKKIFQENNLSPLVELKKKHKYPTYVFKDKELVFWSDFRMVPDYNALSGNYKTSFQAFTKGRFIVEQESFRNGAGNKIEMFSLLPVYEAYQLENAYLHSGHNPEIVPSEDIKISYAQDSLFREYNIYSLHDEFLFSLKSVGQFETSDKTLLRWAMLCGVLSALCLGLFIGFMAQKLKARKYYDEIFLIWIAYWVLIRWLMLHWHIPFNIFDWDLFNPKVYASSTWSPSLGDLFLNVCVGLFIATYFTLNFYKFKLYAFLCQLPKLPRYVFSFFCILLTYALLHIHFYLISTFYTDSQILIDISQSIRFTFPHIICLLIFVITSAIYFMGAHTLTRIFIRFSEDDLSPMVLFFGATLTYNLTTYFFDAFYPLLSLLNGLFILVAFYLLLPKYLYRFNYLASVYLFMGALVCATTSTYALYIFSRQNILREKIKFAENLLNERDGVVEIYLPGINNKITLDKAIKNYFIGINKSYPFSEKWATDLVVQKVKNIHLKNEFPYYQTNIHVFDAQGEYLNSQEDQRTYQDFVRTYQRQDFATDHLDLFFVSEAKAIARKLEVNLLRQYIDFIEIKEDDTVLGYIIIDLKKQKSDATTVYPELLQDEKFKEPQHLKGISYAVFSENNMAYSNGEFNYDKLFKRTYFKFSELYSGGYYSDGYEHIALVSEQDKNKKVVVSSKKYPARNVFANFSFFFLILVLMIVNLMIGYALINRSRRFRSTFAARIQFYLNLAFFLPLIVVSVTTLGVISSVYEKDLLTSYLSKAQNAGRSLLNTLQQYKNGKIERNDLIGELSAVGLYAQADINLFDTSGRMIASSQPAIYDNNLISRYINPEAYVNMIEQNEKNFMLSESVGSLNYNSVYLAIRSFEDNQLLGILSIPFFDSKDERDRKIITVLSNIISIFTATFIIFVLLSYFASRILTVPLLLITQKIRKTTLNAYNEPLQWDSDDEIGLLINEYNRMLINLEQSKEALSQTEKETAWREMARQVAHEIKNPLTPMKLTLQHLQMRLEKDNGEIGAMIKKPFQTLLTQIDTLSDIATSFSTFAKMPIPKNEVFDIAKTLRQTLELYKSNQNVHLMRSLENGEFFVRGDEQLMGRIFTNIILNSIQAVPPSRVPEIYVSLLYNEDNRCVRIEVRDNGLGIPPEIQKKIFLPNFSTKFNGSGIGLALAKRGIEHAGGSIWFETNEDEGTCFFVEIPLV